jgi:hypothetical protein
VTQEDAPRGLVLPRPNPGPESWYETHSIPEILVVVLLVFGCVVLCWFFWSRLRRRRTRLKRGNLVPEVQPDATPRERLVALSKSIRATLTVQYGTTWRAKTTEELSADAQLVQAVGREEFDDLIRFFDQVDRIKFAPARSNQNHDSLQNDLAIWEPRVADLNARIRAKPARRRGSHGTDPRLQLPASQVTPRKNRP